MDTLLIQRLNINTGPGTYTGTLLTTVNPSAVSYAISNIVLNGRYANASRDATLDITLLGSTSFFEHHFVSTGGAMENFVLRSENFNPSMLMTFLNQNITYSVTLGAGFNIADFSLSLYGMALPA